MSDEQTIPDFETDYLNLMDLTDKLPSILKKIQEETKERDVTIMGVSATLADMLLVE